MDVKTAEPRPPDLGERLLDILRVLGKMPKNLPEYYTRLVRHDDLFLRIGGLAAQLDLGSLAREDWDTAVASSTYGAVARRAFPFFTKRYEYDYAKRVLAAFAEAQAPDLVDYFRA